jgi:hypothetical protein
MMGEALKTLMDHKILALIVLGMIAMVLIGTVLGSSGDGKCIRECDSAGLNCKGSVLQVIVWKEMIGAIQSSSFQPNQKI